MLRLRGESAKKKWESEGKTANGSYERDWERDDLGVGVWMGGSLGDNYSKWSLRRYEIVET